MLDVVFIMLIFFVVTASFVKESGYQLTRPEENQQPPLDAPKNILFTINANNEVFLDQRRIDARSVRANVERMSAANPEASIIIQADPKAKNRVITLVSNQSREAGVNAISLIIQTD
jgi:biopolymer transport protein ExbD